jgi:hypothetical protein
LFAWFIRFSFVFFSFYYYFFSSSNDTFESFLCELNLYWHKISFTFSSIFFYVLIDLFIIFYWVLPKHCFHHFLLIKIFIFYLELSKAKVGKLTQNQKDDKFENHNKLNFFFSIYFGNSCFNFFLNFFFLILSHSHTPHTNVCNLLSRKTNSTFNFFFFQIFMKTL